jgi:UTP--glucose-1-phosphate uridylyltransferase
VTEQLSLIFNETGLSTVAVMEVASKEVEKYGIIAGQDLGGNRYRVSDVVEKPAAAKAPSRLALPGRYVFSNKIFDYLRETKPGKNGEYQLTDGMVGLAKKEGLLATTFEGQRYDAGDKLGYLIANVELALKNPELRSDLQDYLKKLTARW